MDMMLRTIKERRAVRRFKKETVHPKTIENILEAARWSPSGMNNQPWKFMVLDSKDKNRLSDYTVYSSVIREADKVILIFLDKKESYNYEKDLMAIGACIQNVLLYIHSIGLGACWLGEILSKRVEIEKFLKLTKDLELEAVIALGRPAMIPKSGRRTELAKLIIHR
jgi:nitroreductase